MKASGCVACRSGPDDRRPETFSSRPVISRLFGPNLGDGHSHGRRLPAHVDFVNATASQWTYPELMPNGMRVFTAWSIDRAEIAASVLETEICDFRQDRDRKPVQHR
jgi:hypothetical protein